MKWAALVPASQLPAILLMKHWDWPRPFRWVPRRWFAWLGDPPRKLLGNATMPLMPIPENGQWFVSWPLGIAIKTKRGYYGRLLFRWDDVQHYYQLSAALKHYK